MNAHTKQNKPLKCLKMANKTLTILTNSIMQVIRKPFKHERSLVRLYDSSAVIMGATLIFWLFESIVFCLIYGWHWQATHLPEIIADKIVSYGLRIGIVLWWLASDKDLRTRVDAIQENTALFDNIQFQKKRFTDNILKNNKNHNNE